jgi:hypothetical protein
MLTVLTVLTVLHNNRDDASWLLREQRSGPEQRRIDEPPSSAGKVELDDNEKGAERGDEQHDQCHCPVRPVLVSSLHRAQCLPAFSA